MKAPTRDERRTEARRLLDGLNGQWVARRMGVGDATVSAWRRGDRVPDLGDLLALAIAVGRPLDPELDAQVVRLLEAGRITVSPRPAVIEQAEAEAAEIAAAGEESLGEDPPTQDPGQEPKHPRPTERPPLGVVDESG